MRCHSRELSYSAIEFCLRPPTLVEEPSGNMGKTQAARFSPVAAAHPLRKMCTQLPSSCCASVEENVNSTTRKPDSTTFCSRKIQIVSELVLPQGISKEILAHSFKHRQEVYMGHVFSHIPQTYERILVSGLALMQLCPLGFRFPVGGAGNGSHNAVRSKKFCVDGG